MDENKYLGEFLVTAAGPLIALLLGVLILYLCHRPTKSFALIQERIKELKQKKCVHKVNDKYHEH